MKRVGVFLVLALVGGGIATALVVSSGDSGDPVRSTAQPTGLIDRALSTPDLSPSPTPTPTPAQARRSSASSQAPPADVGSTDREPTPSTDELPEGPFSSVEGAFGEPSTGENRDGERDFEAACANEDNEAERDRCENDLEAEEDEDENEAEAEEDDEDEDEDENERE